MSSALAYPTRYIETLFRAVSPAKLDLQNVLANITSATAAASAGPLDHFYARIGALNGPFFPAGWGNLSVVNYEEDLRHLLAEPISPMKLSWRLVERGERNGTDYLLYEGSFRTPCLQRVYDALPPESRMGRVQLLMPAHLKPFHPDAVTSPDGALAAVPAADADPTAAAAPAAAARSAGCRSAAAGGAPVLDAPACVVHLAATGDQTFGRRLRLGFPLLKDNVCSLVLESPFYGARRPEAQRGSKLLRVSDLLTLGWATIAESIHLLHWLRAEGYGALGMCGLSMGGVHASMTAGLFPGDVAVAPLLAPRSAAVAYCDGAMRAAMAWEPLLREVDDNNNHITHVVRAAGRAVRVELPLATASATSASVGGSGGGDGYGSSGRCVALMREATYALVDLEARGEDRFLAESESQAGFELGQPHAAQPHAAREAPEAAAGPAFGGAGWHASPAAAVVAAGDARAGAAAGGAEAVPRAEAVTHGSVEGSAFHGHPFLSVMDVQSGLALEALREGGSGAIGATVAASTPLPHSLRHGSAHQRHQQGPQQQGHQQQGHQQRHPSPHSTPCEWRVQDGQMFEGSFSGVIAAQPPQSLGGGGHTSRGPGARGEQPGPDCRSRGGAQWAAAAVAPAAEGVTGDGTAVLAPTASAAAAAAAMTKCGHTHHPPASVPGAVTTAAAAAPAATSTQPAVVVDMSRNATSPDGSASSSAAEVADGGGGASGGGSGGGGGATALGRRLLGELERAVKAVRADDRRMDRPDTVLRLKQVLETYTDVTRYPRPRRTDAAVIVAARDDAYVSCESVQQLHRYWPGSELRMVSGGHVSAFLIHQESFRGAIRDSLARVAAPPPAPAPPQQPQQQ